MRDTIDSEEFNRRLDAANVQLRQELVAAQERVRRLEELLLRKQNFSQKLDRILAEIEQDEAEIAAAEKELHPRHVARRRS